MSLRLSAACHSLVVGLLLSVVALLTLSHAASAQVMQPMCVTGCIPYNVDVPNIGSRTWAPNTSGHTAIFQVWNKGSSVDEYEISCSRTAPVSSCSVSLSDISLDPGEKQSVTVTYSVGSAGTGSITLTADGTGDDDSGMGSVYAAGPPTITLAAPGSGSSVTVHNRQPIIRAYFTPGAGDLVDTTKTVLTWRGDTVTTLARHNRGLLEWEVDSTHWLTAGLPGHAHADTAVIVLKACGIVGGCTTATRSVILSDATPILGFSGVPLGYANAGYSAPFGPGLSVQGADVSTGFSTRSRTTLGRARSVGLVYSTRTSYPRVLVPVDLDIPWPTSTPSSVTVRLKDGAIVKDSLKLTSPNTSCLTGTIHRCRVTLQADYSASTQTVARKWLTVEATVVTDQARTSSDSVEVVIVDRRQSPYGSGWWPTMYTQLVQAGSDRILVSASGAASIYRGNGDTLFIPPPGSFTSITYTGLHELRTRGSTAYQVFDIYGRISFVYDPSGNRDYITYDGTSDRLRWRIDPSGSGTPWTSMGMACSVSSWAPRAGAIVSPSTPPRTS